MEDWRNKLDHFLEPEQNEKKRYSEDALRHRSTTISTFLSEKAIPAFEEIKAELEKYGREIHIMRDGDSLRFFVHHDGILEIEYRILFRIERGKIHPEVKIRFPVDQKIEYEHFPDPYGEKEIPLDDINKQEIISHFLKSYQSLQRKSPD